MCFLDPVGARTEWSFGLIGPSANAIGNEATVEVGYTDLQEVPDWARRFTRQHDGDVFDMPHDEYEHLFARTRTLFETKWSRAWKPHRRA